MDAIVLLRSIQLFQGLCEDDLAALSSTLERQVFQAGATIFAHGDVGSCMYIIESGRVNIHLPVEAARRILVDDLGRGDFFGELALFDDKPRSASALAVGDTVLLGLRRTTLETYLKSRPHAAMALLRSTSMRLRETNRLLSVHVSKNVDEEFDKNMSLSDRVADVVAKLNGSWKFILLLLAVTIGWCMINTNLFFTTPPDPYPYQFFNLALAILVGLQGPLIVMSQNRQSRKDRARADTDFKVNLKNEVNIEALVRELGEFRAELADRRVPPPSSDARETIPSDA